MQFFITSTGTDIGKTFIVQKLCRQIIKNNKKIEVIKPIISGFNDRDMDNDSIILLKTLNKSINQENLDNISPFRFKAPLSPNIAAKNEGQEIIFEDVVNFCKNKISLAKKNKEYLLIEGAGGIMTPITNNKTFCDLISELEIPAILVIGNYLGTISHTLTAINTLESSNIKIGKIIFNCQKDDKIDSEDTLKTLKGFTDINIERKISI